MWDFVEGAMAEARAATMVMREAEWKVGEEMVGTRAEAWTVAVATVMVAREEVVMALEEMEAAETVEWAAAAAVRVSVGSREAVVG